MVSVVVSKWLVSHLNITIYIYIAIDGKQSEPSDLPSGKLT